MTGKKLRILVIDDEQLIRETICENLIACGFDVTSAVEGDDAARQMSQGPLPDIVVTDIIMPRREGLETISVIRKNYPTVKIIAISGGGRTKTSDFLATAIDLGANAVLEKPLDMDELERVIQRIAHKN